MKPCRQCAETFTPAHNAQSVCSDECRRERRRQYARQYRTADRQSSLSLPSAKRAAGRAHARISARRDAIDRTATIACRTCSTETPALEPRNLQPSNYCSRACKDASPKMQAYYRHKENTRRAIKHGAGSDTIDRDYIWQRDAGRCHLCTKPTDPHTWHLDHIEPLSKGGAHTYANVAVSHPSCNIAKGNRSVNDQMRLVG